VIVLLQEPLTQIIAVKIGIISQGIGYDYLAAIHVLTLDRIIMLKYKLFAAF